MCRVSSIVVVDSCVGTSGADLPSGFCFTLENRIERRLDTWICDSEIVDFVCASHHVASVVSVAELATTRCDTCVVLSVVGEPGLSQRVVNRLFGWRTCELLRHNHVSSHDTNFGDCGAAGGVLWS